MKHVLRRKAFLVTSGLVILLLLTLLLPVLSSQSIKVQQSQICTDAVLIENARYQELSAPNAPVGTIDVYTFTADSPLPHDAHLAFYSVHQLAEVAIDGKVVYRHVPKNNQTAIKTVGCNWVLVPLEMRNSGKEIQVTLAPVYELFRGHEMEFYVGSAMSIYENSMHQDILVILLCITIILIGIVFIIFAAYSNRRYNTGISLLLLGLSAVMLGLWKLLDTEFAAFLMPNHPLFWYYLSLTMLMLCTLPLYQTIARRFPYINANIMNTYLYCFLLCNLVQLLLQVLGIYDLRETLFATHTFILIGASIVVGSVILHFGQIIRELRTNPESIFLLLLLIGAIIDLAIFYITNTTTGLVYSLTAYLLYTAFTGFRLVASFINQEQLLLNNTALLAAKEQQLTQSRIVSMTGQIRAHFIFNILNAISGLCKYDPEKADETIICFSRFLRTNINVLEDDKPVTFNAALAHLEDYIALEQVRFGNKIRFETNIQHSDFMIPPLILQPIVENSVKHGLTTTTRGGTIYLDTWLDNDTTYVQIRDDGVGYDTFAPQKDDSTGLRNVRFRLKHVANGDMTIKSIPGYGTTVTITIPCPEVT